MENINEKTEAELIEEIIKNDVISYIDRDKQKSDDSIFWLVAVIKQEDYHNPDCDYQQRHYNGITLKEALKKILL